MYNELCLDLVQVVANGNANDRQQNELSKIGNTQIAYLSGSRV